MNLRLFTAVAMLLVAACSSPELPLPETRFDYVPAEFSGVDFANQVRESAKRNIGTYDYMYNGGGVAIADLDGDSLPDLVFCGNDTPSRIYRNLGGLRFEDVTEQSGIIATGFTTGVTVTDLNNDGLPDVYFCLSGPDFATRSTENRCYINQGGMRFTEEAAQRGINDNGLSTQAVFFDVDRDGDPDLFVANHSVRNLGNLAPEWFDAVNALPAELKDRFTCHFYRNNGAGVFTRDDAVLPPQQPGFALGVAVSDFNDDGWPDLFVAHDYFIPDQLLLNNGDGKLRDATKARMAHTSFYSMGCDAADFNNDGLVDLFVPDMSPADHYRSKMLMAGMDTAQFRFLERIGFTPQYMFNVLHLNRGEGMMSDVAHLAGVAKTDWSWSPLFCDLDNDGHKDLYVTNGIVRETTNNDWRLKLLEAMKSGTLTDESYFALLQSAPSQPIVNAVRQQISELKFEDRSAEWGLGRASFSNGCAVGDLDNDGDLDIVVNNLNDTAFIIRNTSADRGAGYLRVRLREGFAAEGAVVTLHHQGTMQRVDARFTRGFQSFSEPVVHFGLGQHPPATVDSIVVIYPNGVRNTLVAAATSMTHVMAIPEGGRPSIRSKKSPDAKPYWDVTAQAIRPPAVHTENPFDDFRSEQLLPQRTSTLGPALAVGDFNGDGLDDFFLGGALGEPAQIYVQDEGGFFRPYQWIDDSQVVDREVIGAAAFDADGDGKTDLYLACGGGGALENQPELLTDLLLLNRGNRFVVARNALPALKVSTAAVIPFDLDGDGDLDLFVGGRNRPGKYPFGARSFILENLGGGRFADATLKRAPGMEEERCVTDAVWVQEGLDGRPTLFIVGEWMAPEAWVLELDGVLRRRTTSLDALTGWWQSVTAFDWNGKPYLLLGNYGENNKFHPDVDQPLRVFADDFDGNGTLDIVLSKPYENRLVPVRGRACSSSQMPGIKERFPTYDAFARADLEEILGVDNLDAVYSRSANTFTSGWVELTPTGLGQFTPLPPMAQISPIFGTVQTGSNELITAGNYLQTEVETTPYDASLGILLTLAGDGRKVQCTPTAESGVFLPGDVRCVLPIRLSRDGIPAVIAAVNGGRVRVLLSSTPANGGR
ncbi:MAG: VCBS repeat-containing protein [Flavobacteriales bacterium]